ncbi:unnamed protein product [Tilletia laevis]|uniref:Plus3 domain-containing protein n=2 Tax=Tilletia TaxID=13289 RepID=A0A177VG56_9BASI|nr:hypothetical protein CF335_g6928 [Tilletia laevis]KAE8265119.1 hypothetical protein A4X03_0g475 [Tilletia caries]CAD6974075.1 unnamed protein product [Tilletia controversa]KAE8200542.1 hypothetical protein CF336_g633 [Tilletia laevis]CAD6886093.1 unnamed protein product [Tilletia caries]
MSQHNLDDDLLALLENGSDQDDAPSSGRARAKAAGGGGGGGSGGAGGGGGGSGSGANGSGAGGNGASARNGSSGAGGGAGMGSGNDSARGAMEVDEEDEDDEGAGVQQQQRRSSSSSKKRSSSSLSKRSGGGGSSSNKKKRRRLHSFAAEEDEEDDDDDDDEGDGNPYRLDGLFRDEDDRDRLMSMNEVQREAELERRREETKRYTDRLALKQMLEKQQGGAGGASSSRRSTSAPKSSSRAKARRSRRDADSDDEDAEGSDEDMAVEQDEDDEDDEEDHRRSSRRGVTSSSIATAAKSRKRSAVGASAKKDGALNELKQRREARKKGLREEVDEEDFQTATKVVDSSDGESDESDGYQDSDAGRARARFYPRSGGKDAGHSGKGEKGEKKKDRKPWSGSDDPPSMRDLTLCQLTRDDIEKMLHKPDWLEHLVGNYIRFQWEGERDQKGNKVFPVRIHEILEAKADSSSYYELAPGKPCNLRMKIEMGPKPAWVQAIAISNKSFTQAEYERWVLRLRGNKLKFPSRSELDDQQLKMDKFHSRMLSEDALSKMVAVKKSAKDAFKKKQDEEKAAAAENGPAPGSAPPGPPPPRPPGLLDSAVGSGGMAGTAPAAVGAGAKVYNQTTMAELNERNRRMDRERRQGVQRRETAKIQEAWGVKSSSSSSGNQANPALGAAGAGAAIRASGAPLVGSGTPASLKASGNVSGAGTPLPSTQGSADGSAAASSSLTKGKQGASSVVLSLDIDLGDF